MRSREALKKIGFPSNDPTMVKLRTCVWIVFGKRTRWPKEFVYCSVQSPSSDAADLRFKTATELGSTIAPADSSTPFCQSAAQTPNGQNRNPAGTHGTSFMIISRTQGNTGMDMAALAIPSTQ